MYLKSFNAYRPVFKSKKRCSVWNGPCTSCRKLLTWKDYFNSKILFYIVLDFLIRRRKKKMNKYFKLSSPLAPNIFHLKNISKVTFCPYNVFKRFFLCWIEMFNMIQTFHDEENMFIASFKTIPDGEIFLLPKTWPSELNGR